MVIPDRNDKEKGVETSFDLQILGRLRPVTAPEQSISQG